MKPQDAPHSDTPDSPVPVRVDADKVVTLSAAAPEHIALSDSGEPGTDGGEVPLAGQSLAGQSPADLSSMNVSATGVSVVGQLNAFQYAWRNPWIRLAVFLLGFYLFYLFLGNISAVVVTAAVGFLIAYLANPMLNWLEKHRIQRGIGIFFVLLSFFGVALMVIAILNTVVTQFIQLFQKLPDFIEQLNKVLEKVSLWLESKGVSNATAIQDNIEETLRNSVGELGSNITPILQNALGSTSTLLNGIASIGGILGQVVLIILLSVYLMTDYRKVNETLLKSFPIPWQPHVKEFSELISVAVGGYARGQIIVAAFIGVFVWIGLSILGIPSAAAIGFLAGAFNIIPYLGPVIGAAPAILLALSDGGWMKAVWVIVVFFAANQIEGSFLSPYILSKNTDLHPVTVLLSILIGAALFGFAGALLSVPVVALMKLMMEKYYFSSRIYTEGP